MTAQAVHYTQDIFLSEGVQLCNQTEYKETGRSCRGIPMFDRNEDYSDNGNTQYTDT